MADRTDHTPTPTPNQAHATDLDARRITAAAARAADHATRQLWLLERAAQHRHAQHDTEHHPDTDTATRDFTALTQEHGLEH
jgi:hypothetical protein